MRCEPLSGSGLAAAANTAGFIRRRLVFRRIQSFVNLDLALTGPGKALSNIFAYLKSMCIARGKWQITRDSIVAWEELRRTALNDLYCLSLKIDYQRFDAS